MARSTHAPEPDENGSRLLPVLAGFSLARTTAPVWWARGRWASVDWRAGTLWWTGWESDRIVWRSVRQITADRLLIAGSGAPDLDGVWAARALGVTAQMPEFDDPILANLARRHSGMRSWAQGSLFDGAVSSIIGQSISVAAAATTERRVYELFNPPLALDGRLFWPSPRTEQLAAADPGNLRACGVTTIRAVALIRVGAAFAAGEIGERALGDDDAVAEAEKLLAVRGVGPWTVRSALLWGIGDPDAHPSGDVALLRAVAKQDPAVSTLRELDARAEMWRPHRAWAARLLWLDLLGHAEAS